MIPTRMTPGSSGMDLAASEIVNLHPGDIKLVPTGLRLEIPEGYEGQLRIRSSAALKGLMLVNGVGTIDSDYRGDLKFIITNISRKVRILKPYEPIIQLVIAKVEYPGILLVDRITGTLRDVGGFGSTDKIN